jgi:hypothetical protein
VRSKSQLVAELLYNSARQYVICRLQIEGNCIGKLEDLHEAHQVHSSDTSATVHARLCLAEYHLASTTHYSLTYTSNMTL